MTHEVQGHLHALFVIAHLTLEQQCIMSAAGLLPVRGMQIPLFYDFLKLHDMTAMNQLLELGWLRCDEKNNVVSVHPLIALLCRHSHLTKPSVDHCRTFLNSFSKYLRRPPTICDNDFSMSLAQNILTHTKCDSDKIEYIEFQDNYGYFQFLSGNYVASENNILSAVEALWKKRQYAKAVPVCIDYAMVLEIQRKMELEADFLHDLEELPEFRAVYQKEPQLYFEVLVIWGTWLRVQSQQKQAIDRLERAEALLDSENIKIFRQQMVAQLYYELSTCKYQIRKEVPGYLEQAEDAAWKSLRYREAEYGKADVSLASLWMYAAIAPVPLSAFAGEPSASVGKNFLRSYAGVCLQGVVIALACIIFSALATSAPAVDPNASAITAVWSYVGEMAFNLLVLVGAVKGCDRIVKEIMGL